MFQCSRRQHRQVRVELHKGVVWVCENCGGRLAAIGLLRSVAADLATLEEYWSKARLHPAANPFVNVIDVPSNRVRIARICG